MSIESMLREQGRRRRMVGAEYKLQNVCECGAPALFLRCRSCSVREAERILADHERREGKVVHQSTQL